MLTRAAPGSSTYFMLVVDGHGVSCARGFEERWSAGARVKERNAEVHPDLCLAEFGRVSVGHIEGIEWVAQCKVYLKLRYLWYKMLYWVVAMVSTSTFLLSLLLTCLFILLDDVPHTSPDALVQTDNGPIAQPIPSLCNTVVFLQCAVSDLCPCQVRCLAY